VKAKRQINKTSVSTDEPSYITILRKAVIGNKLEIRLRVDQEVIQDGDKPWGSVVCKDAADAR
jgi:hypothetical protein